jgi:RNA polymerase sigma factor (sigma-70 family)
VELLSAKINIQKTALMQLFFGKKCLNSRLQSLRMNESAIICGCKEKNPIAQEALYRKYAPKMMGVCFRYARNKEDAEDMLQESFVRIFTQIHQYLGTGSFEGWMRKVVVHTSINHLKKYKRFSECIDVFSISEYLFNEEYTTTYLEEKDILESIRRMPLGYKTVLNLFAIEGYSHKEIAEMLEIQESTSRSQYMRAKSMLEKILIDKKIMLPVQHLLRS